MILRRSSSVLKLVFLFTIFSSIIFWIYMTWESKLLQNVQREKLQELLISKFGAVLDAMTENPANLSMSKRDKEIEELRVRLNLTNPGEMGEGVSLPKNLPDDIKRLIDDGWRDYTINEFVSNLIPLSRSLPDPRDKYCHHQIYNNLPKASVIIIFHNEAWSMILRTMHSVLDRAPLKLLEEIILVDDCSDRDHLQKPLEDYIAQFPKVKILRSPRRNGVMLSRMWGASNAKGPVLVFIDCHMEVMPGFLEPLLDRIARNRNSSAIPMIDILDRETLQYKYYGVKESGRHGFEWSMDHNWIPLPDYERKRHSNPWEPYYSVTMLGAMFSIHKDYFKELGMYDPMYGVYGAEDIELSFKVWLCGGILEQVPCSHAAHMFRRKFFYSFPKGGKNYRWNTDRLAEVWLDDYKKYYYRTVGDTKRDFGDISEQVELRKRLKCKPFGWLIDNIYPDIPIPDKIKDPVIGNKTKA